MAAKMNRRDMLKLFTAGVASSLVLDPEKLLWVPGEKTIFLPPVVSVTQDPTYFLWELAIKLDTLAGHDLAKRIETEWTPIDYDPKKLVVRFGSNEP